MPKYKFQKVFGWVPWITLLILGGWAGLFIVDIMSFGTRNVGILVVLLILAILSWGVDALMKDNPDNVRKYFIEWLIVCGLLLFLGLTIWVWA
ncbi:MAG: hypothetical protein EU536_03345 [Promethearchaeota archaeon]|nr:MAG: hypothetical protein EU536_03345 [Candidatus Lokiarchaeota archaeon]